MISVKIKAHNGFGSLRSLFGLEGALMRLLASVGIDIAKNNPSCHIAKSDSRSAASSSPNLLNA